MPSGILARARTLDVWLHASVVVLVLASTVRYLGAHGLGDRGPWVLGGAALLLAAYALQPRRHDAVWCVAIVALWGALAFLAPSFTWLAVPLSFVVLRVMPYAAALPLLGLMIVTVVTSWSRMRGFTDPTLVTGPVCVAVLAVVAYRSLEREARERQELLDELEAAQGDLAAAQHRAGALSERTRLSRDIHDSVAQGLSSINLLLQAAERDWEERPAAARAGVEQAAAAARHGLDDIRQVVRNLVPDAADESAHALPVALRSTVARVAGVDAEVHVHGDPRPVPAEVATALLRSARGALANVVEHSQAGRAWVSLTYQPDEVTLDVRDEGRGFDPAGPRRGMNRGHGLAGIRDRAAALGGRVAVESAPGEGTVVSISIPLEET